MRTRGEIRCSGRVSISCYACGTRYNVPYVVSRNETYSWQQYHYLQMSLVNHKLILSIFISCNMCLRKDSYEIYNKLLLSLFLQDYTEPGQCSVPGYTYNKELNTCIKRNGNYKTWDDARLTCQSEGTRLMVVDTVNKNNIMKTMPGNNHIYTNKF